MDKKILCHHVGILLVACLLPSVSPSTGSRPGLLPFAKAAHSFRHRDLPRPTKETEGKGMPETDNESLMFCESCGKRDVSILYRIRGRKRRTFLFRDLLHEAYPCLAIDKVHRVGMTLSALTIQPAKEAWNVQLQLSTNHGRQWVNLLSYDSISPDKAILVQPSWLLRLVHNMDAFNQFHVLHIKLAIGVWALVPPVANRSSEAQTCPPFGEGRLCQCLKPPRMMPSPQKPNQTVNHSLPTGRTAAKSENHSLPTGKTAAKSDKSRSRHRRHADGVQTPIISNLHVLSSTSILLAWKQPVPDLDENPPEEYHIDVTADGFEETMVYQCDEECGKDAIKKMAVETGYGVQFKKVISGLQPFTKYNFEIKAADEDGESEPSLKVEARTSEAEPEFPPANVRVTNITTHSVRVQWDPIPMAFQHGILERYELTVTHLQTSEVAAQLNISATPVQTSASVHGLDPMEQYQVIVQGFTAVGPSPQSEIMSFSTGPTVPKAPVNVTASPLSPTSIRVKWSPPQHHNALVERYGVQYWPLTLTEQHAREISTLDTMAFIDRLSPAAQYAVRVVAYQNTSRGVVSNAVNVTTQQQSLKPIMSVQAAALDSTTVNVTWVPDQQPQPVPHDNRDMLLMFSQLPSPGSATHFQYENQATVSHNVPLSKGYDVMAGLKPYSFYNVTMAMVPSEAADPQIVSSTLIHTPDTAPALPIEVLAPTKFATESSLVVEWKEPPIPHSPVSYTLIAEAQPPAPVHRVEQAVQQIVENVTDATGRILQWRMTDLHSNTEYSIRVQGSNSAGTAVSNATLALTAASTVTGPPENVQAHGIGYNEIHVQWQQPTKRIGPVLQYTVAYAPVNKTIGGAVTMLPDQVPYVRRLQYSSLTTMCRLHGLYAGQSFAVWVWATTWTATGSAKGQPSQAVIAHTDGANSGGRSLSDLQALSAGQSLLNPSNLRVQSTGPRTVDVRWQKAAGSSIVGYIIKVLQIGHGDDNGMPTGERSRITYQPWLVARSALSSTEIELHGLRPYTKYAVEVFGFSPTVNSTGTGQKFVVTQQSTPSLPPTHLEVNALSSQALLLTWTAPSKLRLNGLLHGFEINVTKEYILGGPVFKSQRAFVAGHLPNTFTANALQPATSYLVSVAAMTGGGTGPAAVVLQTTQEDAPSDLSLDAVVVNDSTLNVTWKLSPNGQLLHLALAYTARGTNISRGENHVFRRNLLQIQARKHIVLYNLLPYQFYTLELSAATSKGSSKTRTAVFTAENTKDVVSDTLQITGCRPATPTSIRVQWRIDPQVAKMISYLKLVTSSWYQNSTKRRVHNVTLPVTATATRLTRLLASNSYAFRLYAVLRKNNQKIAAMSCHYIAPTIKIETNSDIPFNNTKKDEDSTILEDTEGTGSIGLAVALPILVIVILSCAILVYRCKGCDYHARILAWLADDSRRATWMSPEKLKIVDLSHLHHLQVAYSRLHNMQPIGEGNFGKVYMAEAEGIGCGRKDRTLVAVKALKDADTAEARRLFYQEIKTMSELSHPNLLRLLGICTKKRPIYLITEFMNEGDLKSVLVASRTNNIVQLTDGDLLHIIHQVSSAMGYLSSKHFIHRDLAARNCLVSHGLCVKVADFGLARRVGQASSDYYRASDGLLPVRWMPPEALLDGMFSTASDIWAFGVFCWEVYTLGQLPYPGCANSQIVDWIRDGNRLLKPELCPGHIFESMEACWREEANARPTFKLLNEFLTACIKTNANRQQTIHHFDEYDSEGDYVIANGDTDGMVDVDLNGYESAWDVYEYDVADAPHLVMNNLAAKARL